MKPVATEADADVVRLFTIAGLTAPHGEEAEHHAFVGDAIQVVQLWRDPVLGARRIESIGGDPRRRGRAAPLHARELLTLTVQAMPRQTADFAPGTDAVHPHS